MNLYNMLHGYSSACITILPMLGRKPEDYPRFRDCVVLNSESIVIYTRVGGNNRGCGYGEEELLKDPHFIRTFDDVFDSAYGYYLFTVPEKWKKDFEAIMEGRFFDVSDEYVEYLEEIVKGDPEKLARIRATQFKKGQKPANELPVGTVVVNSDGYKLRKKQMEGTMWERWEMLHRAVWEEHNGLIPEGMVVGFKDGNALNCDISNLMLMTRSENAQIRPLRSEDPDITDAALTMVRLKNAVKEKRKERNR